MASEGAFSSFGNTAWTADAFKSFTALSLPVKRHLQKVYLTLTAALAVCALGVYVHLLSNVGGALTHAGFIICSLGLMALPSQPSNEGTRLLMLAAASFCQGCSLGDLVGAVLEFDPSILITAFVGTATVFACFTGAACLSQRRSFLYLGSVLSSAVSLMLVMHLVSWCVGGSAALFRMELYGGLLLFIGYILFDTQLIIERASRGEMDYVKHALDLFIDFIAIFVRILIILSQNRGKQEEKRKRKGNTSRR